MKRKQAIGCRISLYPGFDLRADWLQSLKPATKWARIGFMLLVADCPYRPLLCTAPGIPMTDRQIAGQLGVKIPTWKEAKELMAERGEIIVDKKVGITLTNFRKLRQRNPGSAGDCAHHDPAEIKRNEEVKSWLIDRWNLISGTKYGPTEHLFSKYVNERIAEGVTQESLDVAMRAYLWVKLQASPVEQRRISPYQVFSAIPFLRWLKIGRSGHLLPAGKFESTGEYIKSLPQKEQDRARALVSDYYREIREGRLKNGWDELYSVDWSQVMTCLQYLKRAMSFGGVL